MPAERNFRIPRFTNGRKVIGKEFLKGHLSFFVNSFLVPPYLNEFLKETRALRDKT
jgi:hypothetical protein